MGSRSVMALRVRGKISGTSSPESHEPTQQLGEVFLTPREAGRS